MGIHRETDLYAPVKQLLERQGYLVRGEVKDCDLVAVRGDDLVIVELKRAFNLSLLLQGVERQKLTDVVYLAVEAPRARRGAPRWSEIQHLCRRLGLGLITVVFAPAGPVVEVVCDPAPYAPRKPGKQRGLLLREFQRRSGDYNTGGGTRRPLVTAYREEALRVAASLMQLGPAPVKAVRAASGSQQAGTILQRDYYGWFERVARGIYQLTAKGDEALRQYADVVMPETALAPIAAAQEPGEGER